MTSYELIRLLERFINVINNRPNLKAFLSTVQSQHSSIAEWLVAITSDPKASSITDFNHRLVNVFAVALKEAGSRAIYAEVEQMLSEMASIRATYGEPVAQLMAIDDQLTAFINRYESFLQKTTTENILALIEAATDLTRGLSAYLRLATTIEGFLKRDEIFDEEGYSKLSLLLSYEPSYKNLLTTLIALDQLYNELCNLLGVSSAEYPLQVAKMEVGSLWLKIFGESKVIALLTRLIETGAGYLYRRFTTEGKIASIPRQVESVEAILRLTETLQEMGIDTTGVKENLQKSAVVISSRLNDLLTGSPSITVNDRDFSVGDAVTEKYLMESRRLLLDEGKETGEL
jgi:hypothetical protein